MSYTGTRPTGPKPQIRKPKYAFGDVLENRHGFRGYVTEVYADMWAAIDGLAVPKDWFERQEIPPSSKEQVFYGLIGLESGAALVGEDDAKPIRET
jgi:hypothetical protein